MPEFKSYSRCLHCNKLYDQITELVNHSNIPIKNSFFALNIVRPKVQEQERIKKLNL